MLRAGSAACVAHNTSHKCSQLSPLWYLSWPGVCPGLSQSGEPAFCLRASICTHPACPGRLLFTSLLLPVYQVRLSGHLQDGPKGQSPLSRGDLEVCSIVGSWRTGHPLPPSDPAGSHGACKHFCACPRSRGAWKDGGYGLWDHIRPGDSPVLSSWLPNPTSPLVTRAAWRPYDLDSNFLSHL